jgi:hypothetical protein
MARNMYVDVRKLLQDGLQLPLPDVLPFSEDFCLFYSGSFISSTETLRAGRHGCAWPPSHPYSTTVGRQPSSTWTTTVLPRSSET